MTLNEILEPWILERWPTARIWRSSWRDQEDAWMSIRAQGNKRGLYIVASVIPIGIEYRGSKRADYVTQQEGKLRGEWKCERLSPAGVNYFSDLEKKITIAWDNTIDMINHGQPCDIG